MPGFRSAALAACVALLPVQARSRITLETTVGLGSGAGACAATDEPEITAGDLVHFCCTVRNEGAEALAFHTLEDDTNGVLLRDHEHRLEPRARYHPPARGSARSQSPSRWVPAPRRPRYRGPPRCRPKASRCPAVRAMSRSASTLTVS